VNSHQTEQVDAHESSPLAFSESVSIGGNPFGILNKLTLYGQIRLYAATNPVVAYNYVEYGIQEYTTFAFSKTHLWLTLAPISIVTIQLRYTWYKNWAFLEFDSLDATYTAENLYDRFSSGYRRKPVLGHGLSIAPAIQAEVAIGDVWNLAIRNLGMFYWYFFPEILLDWDTYLLHSRGFSYMNEALLVFHRTVGTHRMNWMMGAFDEYIWVSDSKTRTHRIGLLSILSQIPFLGSSRAQLTILFYGWLYNQHQDYYFIPKTPLGMQVSFTFEFRLI
jgi:hypothetical protein